MEILGYTMDFKQTVESCTKHLPYISKIVWITEQH